MPSARWWNKTHSGQWSSRSQPPTSRGQPSCVWSLGLSWTKVSPPQLAHLHQAGHKVGREEQSPVSGPHKLPQRPLPPHQMAKPRCLLLGLTASAVSFLFQCPCVPLPEPHGGTPSPTDKCSLLHLSPLGRIFKLGDLRVDRWAHPHFCQGVGAGSLAPRTILIHSVINTSHNITVTPATASPRQGLRP